MTLKQLQQFSKEQLYITYDVYKDDGQYVIADNFNGIELKRYKSASSVKTWIAARNEEQLIKAVNNLLSRP